MWSNNMDQPNIIVHKHIPFGVSNTKICSLRFSIFSATMSLAFLFPHSIASLSLAVRATHTHTTGINSILYNLSESLVATGIASSCLYTENVCIYSTLPSKWHTDERATSWKLLLFEDLSVYTLLHRMQEMVWRIRADAAASAAAVYIFVAIQLFWVKTTSPPPVLFRSPSLLPWYSFGRFFCWILLYNRSQVSLHFGNTV